MPRAAPVMTTRRPAREDVGLTARRLSSRGVSERVVILGAGFAGLELATRLSETFAGDVEVTLIDRNDSFAFGFSKLDLLLGRKRMADIRLDYSRIDKPGVEFRQETDYVDRRGGATRHDGLRFLRRGRPGHRPRRRLRHVGDAGAGGGRSRVLHVRGRGADARRRRQLRARPNRPRDPRPSVQVPAGAVRGGLPHSRRAHRARRPRQLRDQRLRPAERARAGREGGLAGIPLRAGGTGNPVPRGADLRRARPGRERGAAAERGGRPLRPVHRRSRARRARGDPQLGPGTRGLDPGRPEQLAHELRRRVRRWGLRRAADGEGGRVRGERRRRRRRGHRREAARRGARAPLRGNRELLPRVRRGEVAKVVANFLGGPSPAAELVGPTAELAEEKRDFARTREERWFGP